MTHDPRPLALRTATALLAGCALLTPASGQGEPPARGLARGLTSSARLAGTSGSAWGARHVGRVLAEAGWDVQVDSREVLLSLPRRLELEAFADGEATAPLLAQLDRFDPDAIPPGDVPPFNAWSASGEVRAPVVDVGRGLRGDYERLALAGVEVRGCIALARYGGSYRGVKLDLATGFGCMGLLLFSDPGEGGDGARWPAGPRKPHWAVQRGSVSPMGRSPGDPSTPGFASPTGEGGGAAGTGGVGGAGGTGGERGEDREARSLRLPPREVAALLPTLPCLPVGWGTALALKEHLAGGVGPGPLEVRLAIDQPRDLRVIHNVIARLPGRGEDTRGVVLAGNHRDAWVRGANDAGSGTVSLLRAAQRLGERYAGGWRPERTLLLCFWDGEESGLIGSTEWAEGNAGWLREQALVYINCDAVVSGTRFGASGTPGLLGSLRATLETITSAEGGSLWEQWSAGAEPSLGLPGSGSDFAVFLHHLCVPVLDIHFGGNPGGQYHTSFDGFTQMDRHLDPGWVGHELAGEFLASLLADYAESGAALFDEAQAARVLAGHARSARSWLGEDAAGELAGAFAALEEAARNGHGAGATSGSTAARTAETPGRVGSSFYAHLAAPEGLAGRPWFVNRLWTPGLETGYAAETFPTLRAAARRGEAALAAELADIVGLLRGRASAWAGGHDEPRAEGASGLPGTGSRAPGAGERP